MTREISRIRAPIYIVCRDEEARLKAILGGRDAGREEKRQRAEIEVYRAVLSFRGGESSQPECSPVVAEDDVVEERKVYLLISAE